MFETQDKRNRFVKDRIDLLINSNPIYKELIKSHGTASDAVTFKHFGKGSLNYLSAGSESNFTSHRADFLRIEEYQDCNQDFLTLAESRLDGSDYKFLWRLSNARDPGTAENQNNDWLYQLGDQSVWQVPCARCGRYQSLNWWTHFVKERKSKYGAIESVELCDRDRADPNCKLDPRPVCNFCEHPMGRLVRKGIGQWFRHNPKKTKTHGSFKLSNFYNPTTVVRDLFNDYCRSVRDPLRYRRFVNNQCGETTQNNEEGIVTQMLEDASTCASSGAIPYTMRPFLSYAGLR